MNLEIPAQVDEIRNNLDKLDQLVDELDYSEAQALLKVYQSINIILRAQKVLLTKPKLSIVKE